MKNCFVLTYSPDSDVETVSNSVRTLRDAFPDKTIIALPEVLHLQDYTKKGLIELLTAYSDYIKELLYEPSE